ncbi:MAG: hypothetical protein HOP18_15740 [Deltaproteobacteria bacterium]|nr:hypothetical protein [Deltaproteobacteria bacterium]
MKKITVASLLAITIVSACSSPPEAPKATTPPAPQPQAAPAQAAPAASPSVGKIYGDTLKGGIDKAKEIQETEKERIQKMDEAAGQN